MNDNWERLCDVDAPLAEKRAAIEAFHMATFEDALREFIEDGHLPAAMLPVALEKCRLAVQPTVDQDFVRLVGPKALN